MLNGLIRKLEAVGWQAPELLSSNRATWHLPDHGTVYDRFIQVKEMADGSLLLIKHVIGGISSASFTSADSLFRFLLPYTEMVTS